MLKQELIHSHILVAIFCGWVPRKPTKAFPNGWLELKEEEDHTMGGQYVLEDHAVSNDNILEELPYATDWNYLMAAWNEFDKYSKNTVPDDGLGKIEISITDAILDFNLDLAFKELVRGINTINELKLKET